MVNKVILIGRVGRDPEVRSFDAGVKKASFTLATSESFRTKDGSRSESTEWHNIVLWRNPAEIAERYVRKGSLLYLEGRLRYRSYDDASGNKRYITEIECDVLRLLDKKSDAQQGPVPGGQPAYGAPAPQHPVEAQPAYQPIVDGQNTDDLPF